MNLVKQSATGADGIRGWFTYRSTLVVALVIVALMAAVLAWTTFATSPAVKGLGPGTALAVRPAERVSPLVDPALVEFRRGERAGGSTPAVSAGSLLDPSFVEFRRGERAGGTEAATPAGSLFQPSLVEFRRGEHGGN